MSSWRSPRRVLTVNCLQHDEALIFPLILASAGFIAVNPRPGLQVAFSSVVGKQIRLLQSALTDFDRIVRTLVTKYLVIQNRRILQHNLPHVSRFGVRVTRT